MNIIEEIKSRINIKDLAREYGLNPTKNDFIFSIYKQEKDPSLKLYPDQNRFYDFSYGHGGDVIEFYKDYWRIDFKQAVKELADKAMINNERYKSGRNTREPAKKIISSKSIQILKSERKLFEEEFGKRREEEMLKWIIDRRKEIQIRVYSSLEKFCFGPSSEAMEYLQSKKRGLKEETIKKFRLFSITNVKWLMEYLYQCCSNEELAISGIINKDGKFIFNYHKLIIPYIEDDKIVYLRGRTLQSKGYYSKYISLSNLAGNLTLKRFYNLEVLKNTNPGESIFICEGEFDTMILAQNGYKAIGVPGVTNIPADKIEILGNYDLYVVFDNDEAGKRAMFSLAKDIEKPVKGIKIRKYNDVTELVNER